MPGVMSRMVSRSWRRAWRRRCGQATACLTTADSTATWTFHGSASTCHSVSAFIPDNFADNPQAHHAIGSTLEGFGFTFDQATATGWSSLGALTTGSYGVITVTLNDIGPTTPVSYTAADAMQFAQGGPGC